MSKNVWGMEIKVIKIKNVILSIKYMHIVKNVYHFQWGFKKNKIHAVLFMDTDN